MSIWRTSFPNVLQKRAKHEKKGLLIIGFVTERGSRGERRGLVTDAQLQQILNAWSRLDLRQPARRKVRRKARVDRP